MAAALEGLVYALFPSGAARMARQISETPPERLRGAGVVFVALGAALLWGARQLMG